MTTTLRVGQTPDNVETRYESSLGQIEPTDLEASEFERFENLTRKLVNTSKSEPDEKRKGDR